MDIVFYEQIALAARQGPRVGRGAWVGLALLLAPAAGGCGIRDAFEQLDRDHDGVMLGEDCDEDDPTVGSEPLYADEDGDGHGVSPQVGVGCAGESGTALAADDCDDSNIHIWEYSTWYLDNDRDGFGVEPGVALCASEAVGYALIAGDCLDDDPGAWPGALTSCDGDDNDCDGQTDEGCVLPDGEISPSEADWQVIGSPDAMAGASIAAAGDVDCDGVQDVVVGAPGGAEGEGAVALIYGSAEALLWTFGEESVRVAVLTGDGGGFGVAVGGGVDFDGDGCDDLVVGAPWAGDSLSGRASAVGGWGDSGADGRLTVVLGPLLPAVGAVDELWSVGTLNGDAGGQLGASVRCGGDVFGDGAADCLAGGPLWSLDDEDEVGAVFVLNPPLLGGDAVADVADLMVVGTTELERLGSAVAFGDVNGDGVQDLVMGAPTDVLADFPDHDTKIGRAYVVYDVPGGAYDAEGLADTWVEGVTKAGNGLAVATGDLDGDGYDDLAVGAPRWNEAVGKEGRLSLYSGALLTDAEGPLSDAESFAVLTSADAGAELGTSVEILADMSGDERAELLVGAPGADSTRGAALLFIDALSGAVTEDTALLRVEGSGTTDMIGRAVGGVDVSGLGYEDLLIGGSKEVSELVMETGFDGSGQALVIFMDAW